MPKPRTNDQDLSDLFDMTVSLMKTKVKQGEVTGSELNTIVNFLKNQGIEAKRTPGSPLDELANSLPFTDMDEFEFIEDDHAVSP